MEVCDKDMVRVTCPTSLFRQQLHKIVDLWEIASNCQIDLKKCMDLEQVQKSEMQAQIFELKEKLTSPWRSPFLWLGFGVLGGVAAAFGLQLL
jgi:hypothetical protein